MRDEDEEDDDLRQEGQHPAYAAEDAVGHQASQAPGGSQEPTHVPSEVTPTLIALITGWAQTKTDWKIASITRAKIPVPQTRWVSRRSMRSLRGGLVAGRFFHRAFDDLPGPVEAGRRSRSPARRSRSPASFARADSSAWPTSPSASGKSVRSR